MTIDDGSIMSYFFAWAFCLCYFLHFFQLCLDDGNGGRGDDLADQREGQVRGRAQHLLRHRCWQARVI